MGKGRGLAQGENGGWETVTLLYAHCSVSQRGRVFCHCGVIHSLFILKNIQNLSTMHMSSSEVKTAFVEATPHVVSEVFERTGVTDTWTVLEEMQDVSARPGSRMVKRRSRYSECIRQGNALAPTLWEKIAKYILWKVKKDGKGKRSGSRREWRQREQAEQRAVS